MLSSPKDGDVRQVSTRPQMLRYAQWMNAVSLPARIVYASAALPLGGAAGFYSCMRFLPEFATDHPQLDRGMEGLGIFKIALIVGATIAFTACLFALTLPWSRRRKRRGRAGRIGLSGVVVMLASIFFADQGFGLVYDFAFVIWLTYTVTFTFVRYGLLDQPKRAAASAEAF